MSDKWDALEKLAKAAQAKAPGPWDRDTERVREESIAYNTLNDANGKMLADSFNADETMTCEDLDEDGSRIYDCGTIDVFEYMAAASPDVILELLEELCRLQDEERQQATQIEYAEGR